MGSLEKAVWSMKILGKIGMIILMQALRGMLNIRALELVV